MSLLGRLEDLSLTDIVQIVFLSRRTGILEIVDSRGRHAVMFQHGLVVNGSSPETPDLAAYLASTGLISPQSMDVIRQTESAGVPLGTAILEMNLMSVEELGKAIQQHVTDVITPLLSSRDGEFNFILSDSVNKLDLEYEPEKVFREGGIAPQKIIGGEGEKLKPLRGLEESMRAGKQLLRGSSAPAAPAPSIAPSAIHATEADPLPLEAPLSETSFTPLDEAPFDLGDESAEPEPVPEPIPIDEPAGTEAVPFLANTTSPVAREEPAPFPPQGFPDRASASAAAPVPAAAPAKHPSATLQFNMRGAEALRPEDRNVVLYQRDPMVRVAAKRAFSRKGVNVLQFSSLADTRDAIGELLKKNRFFVTFLDLPPDEGGRAETSRMLDLIKRRNHRLPVVIVDEPADLRRRHAILKQGADLYLTRPSESQLLPGIIESQLALFADELVVFADRTFSDWTNAASVAEPGADLGKAFYEAAQKERVQRSFNVLKQLINELADPGDMNQVSQIILRLAREYVDRAILFAAGNVHFIGLGGFGKTGDGEDMNDRARRLRIPRSLPSILQDVAGSRSAHRGKLKRLAGNVKLVENLGKAQPTEVAVLPIVNQDHVVGVLYCDNAEHRSAIEDTSGLEIFLSQAGLALQNAMIANKGKFGLD